MDIRFGPFLLDLAGHRLLRDGVHVPLSPKAYRLFCVLAEERPRALSRQELHSRLWPGTFVSDVNLACLVNEVRTGLGDHRHLLRTVHRYGYALDVSATGPRPAGGPRVAPPLVVLVLPVGALDEAPATSAAAAELTDELITRLGEAPGFSVVPRYAAAALAREPLDLPALARERGIVFVVESSARSDEAGLHVNVRLVDAVAGASIWSQRTLWSARELPDLHGWLAGALLEAMLGAKSEATPTLQRATSGEAMEGDEINTGHA